MKSAHPPQSTSLKAELPAVPAPSQLGRRTFLKLAASTGAALALQPPLFGAESGALDVASRAAAIAGLPAGGSPEGLECGHFPDRLHAFVWRNWMLVPATVMATVTGAKAGEIREIGHAMGLPDQSGITPKQQRRSYITVIRRNWHLLPYEQLLDLLGWTPEQMAYTLREDDFLFVKLGNLKPKCEPLRYAPPSEAARARAKQIADTVRREFPAGLGHSTDPLFAFVDRLSTPPATRRAERLKTKFSPRFCHSYFALYGDPLLETDAPAYPDGYLARLADGGVDGVWLQGLLQNLAPFPWDAAVSARHQERLAALRDLVQRAGREGIGIYVYLNEPRSMPLSFFEKRPRLKGVVEGEHAAMCTSHPDVQKWMSDSAQFICEAVPNLAGLFTISASENLTNCWSHHRGTGCPRCKERPPADVIAEVHSLLHRGIQRSGAKTRLFAWDWGWADDWAEQVIAKLPSEVALMSVSEWSLPIRRGGIDARVGEYSISSVGPGPRALRHWEMARRRGLKTMAKIQAGNTWELSAVPYIPAIENVARHAANLVNADVDGLMLGWTLGGYPSPNLEVVMEVARAAAEDGSAQTPDGASKIVLSSMQRVASRRFGDRFAAAVVQAWREFSSAFSEFPFDGGVVYNAPLQMGPANLLWERPTGYRATMVGIPYDDLDAWRGPYPADVFITQFEHIAEGFEKALKTLKHSTSADQGAATEIQRLHLAQELNVAETAAIHFASTANQARFVQARRALTAAKSDAEKRAPLAELERTLRLENDLARRLYAIQSRDSRMGFESTNHYFYVPLDLAEKVLNCQDLLERWLPALRA